MIILQLFLFCLLFTVMVRIAGAAIIAKLSEFEKGDPPLALRMAEDVMRIFQSALFAAYLLAAIPLLLLVVYTLRDKMSLEKSSLLFTPLLWMAFFSALKFLVPATPLSNGSDTFCMNAGMMIWFGYLLVKRIILDGITMSAVCPIAGLAVAGIAALLM